MERNEFLKSLGLGIALVCTGSCISSCGSKKTDPAPTPGGGGGGGGAVTATIDISTQLLAVGSFLSKNSVLFIRTAAGNQASSFVATQATCTHQGGNLNWVAGSNLIQCSLHSAQFNLSGATLSQPQGGGTASPIKVFPTSLVGNTLTATVS